MDWSMDQVVVHLLCKFETLSSNPSPNKIIIIIISLFTEQKGSKVNLSFLRIRDFFRARQDYLSLSQVWWYMLIIPGLWRWRQDAASSKAAWAT
jgi:hypothetical protein